MFLAYFCLLISPGIWFKMNNTLEDCSNPSNSLIVYGVLGAKNEVECNERSVIRFIVDLLRTIRFIEETLGTFSVSQIRS